MDYLQENLINWIREQGGWVRRWLSNSGFLSKYASAPDCQLAWLIFVSVVYVVFKEGIKSHFGTPTWQTLAVFLAGVLTTVLVIRKM